MRNEGAALGSNGWKKLACRGWIPCEMGAQPWEVMEAKGWIAGAEFHAI